MVAYDIIEDKQFISFPSFWSIICPRFSILEHRKKREDYFVNLSYLMTLKFLNNGYIKLPSNDCYESFGVTVGDLCFVSRLIIPLSDKFRKADSSSRNVSRGNAMEYLSSVANLLAVIDKCVIVHRDSEWYC